MKMTYLFTLSVLFVSISNPVFAQQDSQVFTESPYLIDHPNPALSDINRLMVIIVPPPSEPNTDGLLWHQLTETVVNQLRKAGINVLAAVAGDILEIPELRLYIDILKISNSQQYVIRVQTSLAKKVLIKEGSKLYIKADVFRTGSLIKEVSVKEMPQAVFNAVGRQVDVFIKAWSVAKSANVNLSGPKSSTTTVEKSTKPQKLQSVESKFVASKNSKVFHKPGCPFAQQILPKNLVSFSTRDEAVASGRRPCKSCYP